MTDKKINRNVNIEKHPFVNMTTFKVKTVGVKKCTKKIRKLLYKLQVYFGALLLTKLRVHPPTLKPFWFAAAGPSSPGRTGPPSAAVL